MRKLLILMVLTLPTSAYAQNVGIGVNPRDVNFSTTVEEGRYRGWAAFVGSVADWIVAQGMYENLHEDARLKYMNNWRHGVYTRWEVSDHAKQRRKEYYENTYGLTARKRRLEKKLEAQAFREYENELREKGLLPPKSVGIIYKGVLYDSYEDFKAANPDLRKQNEEAYKQRLELQKEKREEALEFERQRRRYSSSTLYLRDNR